MDWRLRPFVGWHGRRQGRGTASASRTHPLPSPSPCCSLWNQQHPLSAGHLPPRDFHPRPEVWAHSPHHHRPRAEELSQQRGGADERWRRPGLGRGAEGGSSGCQASTAGRRLPSPSWRVSASAHLLHAASNCCVLFQSGCTSALCSAWWWWSLVLKTMRFWSGGSLISSVTKLQRMRSE